MVRFEKGGVWKNSEDETLKAAVMKYGKNQWARVASLLPKKTAKQAKERWNAWLDPSIKKTEWTKEEEEKLLLLAKTMPCMWRSIAQYVGRTAYQCQQHYQELLDRALEEEGGEAAASVPKSRVSAAHPESRAPMPDGEDMSEDEKEMLNEARARLANTMGKKAKRKAREKQVEEARRLASVQKRRELRAAGIDVAARPMMRGRRKGIDHATEVAFQKAPPPGMFDTTEEAARRAQDDSALRNLDISKAEGVNRQKKESEARREDKKKTLQKKKDDLAAHYEELNRKHDAVAAIKRQALSMPAPQVTEGDLRMLAKAGEAAAAEHVEAARLARTVRTPRVEDTVRAEALTQARQRELAMNTPLHPGATGAAAVAATPVPGSRMAGATPATGAAKVQATPNVYAARAKDVQQELRARAKLSAGRTAAALDALPAPKGRTGLALQLKEADRELLASDDGDEARAAKASAVTEVDAADAAAVKKKKKTGAVLAQPTAAVQRALPRPASLPAKLNPQASAAEKLLEEEVRKLVAYDAAVHPASGKPSKNKLKLDDFAPAELQRAAAAVQQEEAVLKAGSPAFRAARPGEPGAVGGFVLRDAEAVAAALGAAEQDLLFVPNPPRLLSKRQCGHKERLAGLAHEYDVLREHTARQVQVAAKAEKTAEMYTKGYLLRNAALAKQLAERHDELEEAQVALRAYEAVWRTEEAAIFERSRTSTQRLAEQKEKEAKLQARYAAQVEEMKQLQEKIAKKRKREEEALMDVTALAELERGAQPPEAKRART